MLFLMLTLQAALAEDPEFVGTDTSVEVFDTPKATLSAELGGTWATGNSVFYAVNGGVDGGYRWSKNKLSLVGRANLGSSIIDGDDDGRLSESERALGYQENARRYSTDLRYDRYLNEKSSLYVLAGAFIDPFAGYDLRSHEQLGYSRVLVDSSDTRLLAELGVDYAQEYYVDGIEPSSQDIVAARVLVGLTHKFNESVSFANTAELYENVMDFEDLRLLNTATLTSRLSDTFSLKLSHNLIFDNVPVEGYESADQTTMLTLVASLL